MHLMNAAETRSILHIDMDAFFAAVEQNDRPELRGQPVLVGGAADKRGVVSTASYEARRFGCRSAMPMARAVQLCPQAIVVQPRMERYVQISRELLALFEQSTPAIEPLSIDEAFLDVTGSIRLLGPSVQIAQQLKQDICQATGLTASVGIAPNKFLAKLASDLDKPSGLTVVAPNNIRGFLDPLPIARLWGAGAKTQSRLNSLGIRTFADLRQLSAGCLEAEFGQTGRKFFDLARGIDDRPVVSDRQAKSISQETTFVQDVADCQHLRAVLLQQTEQVSSRLRHQGFKARTVNLKIRTQDFHTITRRSTLDGPSDSTTDFWAAAASLFERWWSTRPPTGRIRLIGIGVSQFSGAEGCQMRLFGEAEADNARRLDETFDQIQDRFGRSAIARGLLGDEETD